MGVDDGFLGIGVDDGRGGKRRGRRSERELLTTLEEEAKWLGIGKGLSFPPDILAHEEELHRRKTFGTFSFLSLEILREELKLHISVDNCGRLTKVPVACSRFLVVSVRPRSHDELGLTQN